MARQAAVSFAQAAAGTTDRNELIGLFDDCWQMAFEAGRRDAQNELIMVAVDTDRRTRRMASALNTRN